MSNNFFGCRRRRLVTALVGAVIPAFSLPYNVNGGILFVQATNPVNAQDELSKMAERMATHYSNQIHILVDLLNQPIEKIHDDYYLNRGSSSESILSKGQAAFDEALEVFPDESLPHAHALFAKLCVKIGNYEKSLELFDEAIRRASIPLNNYDEPDHDDDETTHPSREIDEAEALAKQLILERNRAHFQYLQTFIDQWDGANNALHNGGIPPETSPKDPLNVVEHQLEIFPNPHPQALFSKATFMVLLLDSPSTDTSLNRTAMAWEAFETYKKAQTWAYGAFTHGKMRNLAGGKPCMGNEHGFGILVGGTAWSKVALESFPFLPSEGNGDGAFSGIVTLENMIVSGKDAVISGYGSNCQVFVPHRYVDVADNLPIVTSWETPLYEISMGDNPQWLTHIPSDPYAYGGKIGKDLAGNDVLMIPDPKTRGGFGSVVLLTGYASDNYYHFISEVLPSLIVLLKHARGILTKSNGDDESQPRDVVIVPSLQQEFVEGFLKLLLPEAWPNNTLSKNVIQWGASTKTRLNETSVYRQRHPIKYVRHLHVATWDQPMEAPTPFLGPAHSLTPKPLLSAMQRAVWDAVEGIRGRMNQDSRPLKIIYCSRSSSATRRLKEEDELLKRLLEVASSLKGEVVIFEKRSAHANPSSSARRSAIDFVISTVKLFRSASVVVGVHGASLANIAFSSPGTTVVELGFEGLPQTGHYRHLSESFDLNHIAVWLERDARSLGALEVELRRGGLEKVIGAVTEALSKEQNVHIEL